MICQILMFSPAIRFARSLLNWNWEVLRWFSFEVSTCHQEWLALLDFVSSTFVSSSKFPQLFHFPTDLIWSVAPILILLRHVSTPFHGCQWSFVKICERGGEKTLRKMLISYNSTAAAVDDEFVVVAQGILSVCFSFCYLLVLEFSILSDSMFLEFLLLFTLHLNKHRRRHKS